MELVDKENIAGTHNDGPSDSVTSNVAEVVSYHELDEHATALNQSFSDIGRGMKALATISTMGETLGTEPVSTPAMEAIEIAVKHLLASLGGDAATVAFETYQAVGKPNVQMAFEAISDTVKRVWAALIEAIKKAFAHLVSFCRKAHQAVMKTIADVDNQIKRVVELRADRVELDISHLTAWQSLTVGGHLVHGDAFVHALKQHTDTPVLRTDRMPLLKQAISDMSNAMDAEAGDDGEKVIAEATKFLGQMRGLHEAVVPLVFWNAKVVTKVDHSDAFVSVEIDEERMSDRVPLMNLNQIGQAYDALKALAEKQTFLYNADVQSAEDEVRELLKIAAFSVKSGHHRPLNLMSQLLNLTVNASIRLDGYDMRVAQAARHHVDNCFKVYTEANHQKMATA